MRKHIVLVLLAVFAIAMISLGTFAAFTDTESATVTIENGTIAIALNGSDGVVAEYAVEDLKPCNTYAQEFDVTIQNIGNNPAIIWKHIRNDIAVVDGIHVAQEQLQSLDPLLQDFIDYDLSVDGAPVFVYEDGMSLEDVHCMWMPVGTIEPGEEIVVTQSFHLHDSGDMNWAQGDILSYTMDFYAEQKLANGPVQASNKLFLDNKDQSTSDWYFLVDQTWGVYEWDTDTVVASGLDASTGYSLITYEESDTVQVLAFGSTDPAGKLSLTGVSKPSPLPYYGKIWLVPSAALTGNQINWSLMNEYLFESNKVTIL